MGQIYKAQCPGLTGQNVLPEITSSGLSHTQADQLIHPEQNLGLLSLSDSFDSPVYMGLNYGNLQITDHLVKASIKNIDGDKVLTRDYTIGANGDLAFDINNFGTEKMCVARASKQMNFRLLIDKFGQIIIDLNLDTLIRVVVVIPMIIALVGALIIRLCAFILTLCNKVF